MRLRRFFVVGFLPEDSGPLAEFLLFHGIGSLKVTERDDLQKLEVECFYNDKMEPKA